MNRIGRLLRDELGEPLIGWYVPAIFILILLAASTSAPLSFLTEYRTQVSVFFYGIPAATLLLAVMLYLRRYLLKQTPLLFVAFFIMLEALTWEVYSSIEFLFFHPSSLLNTDWLVQGFTTYLVFSVSIDLLALYLLLGWIKSATKVQLAAATLAVSLLKIVTLTGVSSRSSPIVLSATFFPGGLAASDMLLVIAALSVTSYLIIQRRMQNVEIGKTLIGLTAFVVLITFSMAMYKFYPFGSLRSAVLAGASLAGAPVFPLWGVILQEEREKRKTIRLMGLLNDYRPGLDRRIDSPSDVKAQSSGLSLLSLAFPRSTAFSYSSDDCTAWRLVSSFTNGTSGLNPVEAFESDLRTYVRAGEQLLLDSTQKNEASVNLSRVMGNEFAASVYMSFDGRFEITGVMRHGDTGWEHSELTFISNLSWLIKSEMLANDLSEKQSMMTLRLLTLVEASHRLMDIRDSKRLYDTVCELVSERLGYSDASIWVNFNEKGLKLESWRFNGSISSPVDGNTWMAPSKGIVAHCALTLKPYMTGDTAHDPYYFSLLENRTKSEYATPIIVDGTCTAVLDIESTRPDDFDTNDTQVITIVADIVSMALRNIELYNGLAASQRAAEIRANIVAHDLKNMFQPISLNMSLLKSWLVSGIPLSAKELSLVENTIASVDHAGRFLNDVLQLVKLGNAENLNLRETDLEEMVTHAISTVSSTYSQRRLDIRTSFDGGAKMVRGTDLLEEVFVNLFTNAIKYNGSETVEISVASHREGNDGNGNILVSVTDNGRGISPERLATIFNRFSTGSSGSGIGLSLAKGIMESIGGSISAGPRITGEHSKGTVFTLRFLPHSESTANKARANEESFLRLVT